MKVKYTQWFLFLQELTMINGSLDKAALNA